MGNEKGLFETIESATLDAYGNYKLDGLPLSDIKSALTIAISEDLNDDVKESILSER